MIIVTLVNIFAVLLAYLSRLDRYKFCFEFSIILLICFYGIRYNYGNDYESYHLMFQSINSYTQVDYSTSSLAMERGWVLLNRLFAPLGFFSLVFFHTCVQFGSFYFLLKKYVNTGDRYIALFFYLFSSGLMLTMLSMMRQTMAMSIISFAMPFVLNRKLVLSFFSIYIAAQFHQSAYIMMFLPLIVFLNDLNKKTYVLLAIGMLVFLTFFQTQVSSMLSVVVDKYFEKYNNYVGGMTTDFSSGVGLLINLCLFSLLLFYDRHDNEPSSIFMKLKSLSFLFFPLGQIVMIIGRIGTYLNLFGILALVSLCGYIKTNLYCLLVMVLYILVVIYSFFSFFYSEVWRDAFMNYHTIFEVLPVF